MTWKHIKTKDIATHGHGLEKELVDIQNAIQSYSVQDQVHLVM